MKIAYPYIRRRKIFLRVGFFLFGIIVIVCGAIGFFYWSKFRTDKFSVEGAVVLDKEKIAKEISALLGGKFLGILPANNIFLLSYLNIKDRISGKFPLIKKITLKRDFPDFFSVLVEERKFKALWCPAPTSTSTSSPQFEDVLSGEGCAFADEDGFIFEFAPAFSGAAFIKFFDARKESAAVGKLMIDNGEFRKLISFEEMLGGINLGAQKIILKDDGVYEIYLSEGWRILLDAKSDPRLCFENLKLVLSESIKEKRPRLEYIDLRLEKKVFYKFK